MRKIDSVHLDTWIVDPVHEARGGDVTSRAGGDVIVHNMCPGCGVPIVLPQWVAGSIPLFDLKRAVFLELRRRRELGKLIRGRVVVQLTDALRTL